MSGTYILPSIWPHCKEVRTPVEVVEWLGHRVLLRDLEMAAKGREYLIETDFVNFQPTIP